MLADKVRDKDDDKSCAEPKELDILSNFSIEKDKKIASTAEFERKEGHLKTFQSSIERKSELPINVSEYNKRIAVPKIPLK